MFPSTISAWSWFMCGICCQKGPNYTLMQYNKGDAKDQSYNGKQWAAFFIVHVLKFNVCGLSFCTRFQYQTASSISTKMGTTVRTFH